jgi:hypothetical protein
MYGEKPNDLWNLTTNAALSPWPVPRQICPDLDV